VTADHALDVTTLAVVSACVAVWGLVSARFERWEVTGPIAFVVLGLVLTNGPLGIVHLELHSSTSVRWRRSRWHWCCSPMRPG
jgi:hypothetical protein